MKKKKKRRWVGGWAGSNEGNRERDRDALTMLQLLVAQHHKTSAIRAKWQLSWIALSSHTSNLLRSFPNTTTGGAYPGLGVIRVFDLGFGGFGIIPAGSWYSNIGKITTAGSGYLNLFRIGLSGPGIRTGSEQNNRFSGYLKPSDPKDCGFWALFQRPAGSGYLNMFRMGEPWISGIKNLRSKELPVLGVSKTSWVS
ncbi:unnamed protein product [Sphagnum balticum]